METILSLYYLYQVCDGLVVRVSPVIVEKKKKNYELILLKS